jgi:hypothetical protein
VLHFTPRFSAGLYGTAKLSGRLQQMIEDSIKSWLETLELNLEQKVLSGLCLRLAQSFDQNANTSTAAELRKTVLELQRSLGASNVDVDPLEKLLTR